MLARLPPPPLSAFVNAYFGNQYSIEGACIGYAEIADDLFCNEGINSPIFGQFLAMEEYIFSFRDPQALLNEIKKARAKKILEQQLKPLEELKPLKEPQVELKPQQELTPPDEKALKAAAFLESIGLYIMPENFTEALGAKITNLEPAKISHLTQSTELKERGGREYIASFPGIYPTPQSLAEYKDFLNLIASKTPCNLSFGLACYGHRIKLLLDIKYGWFLVDGNSGFRKIDATDIDKIIFNAFQKRPWVGTAFSTSIAITGKNNNPEFKLFWEALQTSEPALKQMKITAEKVSQVIVEETLGGVSHIGLVHIAAKMNYAHLIPTIAECKGDLFLKTNQGLDPVVLALRSGSPDFVIAFFQTLSSLRIPHETFINTPGILNYTLLALSVSLDYPDVAQILLEKKADIDIPTFHGNTPLMLAVQQNNKALITLLLKYHPRLDVNNREGDTVLIMATDVGNAENVNLLLEMKADINCTYRADKRTALHIAMLKGNTAIIHLLVAHKANLDLPDADGFTPLMYAVAKGDVKTVTLLVKNKVNLKNEASGQAVYMAVEQGNLDILKILIRGGANFNKSTKRIKNKTINQFLKRVGEHEVMSANLNKFLEEINPPTSSNQHVLITPLKTLKKYLIKYKGTEDLFHLVTLKKDSLLKGIHDSQRELIFGIILKILDNLSVIIREPLAIFFKETCSSDEKRFLGIELKEVPTIPPMKYKITADPPYDDDKKSLEIKKNFGGIHFFP